MTQQAKKAIPATSGHTQKEAHTAGSAIAKSSAAVVRNISEGGDKVQKAQDTLWKTGHAAMEHFVQSADIIPQAMTKTVELCRSHAEASIECFNIVLATAENVNNEVMQSYNRSAEECAEISKAAFGCRTINDVMELHNRVLKLSFDNCFDETGKLMNIGFECCTALLKPLHDRGRKLLNE